jgi:DNA-binding NarL/FixJ family response regulator
MKVVKVISENIDKTVAVLTPRELQIIKKIADGLTSKEIADTLNMSFRTVEVHRHRILRKTQAKNFVELCLELYKNGILQ